jgi:hypothetical protein
MHFVGFLVGLIVSLFVSLSVGSCIGLLFNLSVCLLTRLSLVCSLIHLLDRLFHSFVLWPVSVFVHLLDCLVVSWFVCQFVNWCICWLLIGFFVVCFSDRGNESSLPLFQPCVI